MTPQEFAALLHRCAQAQNAEDKRKIDAGVALWKGVAGNWSTKGREICVEIDPVWGEVCYYLLGGAWNDILDWADRQQRGSTFTTTNDPSDIGER